MLHLLDPSVASPRTILQVLRTLNKIAEAWTLSTPERGSDGLSRKGLYEYGVLRNLATLVAEDTLFGSAMPQVELIAGLLIKTCSEDSQQKLLEDAFVLEAFVSHLRSWIASSFGPQVKALCLQREPRLTVRDDSQNDRLRHAAVLHVIENIVQFSNPRAQRVLSACSSIFEHVDGKFLDAWTDMTKSPNPTLRATWPGPPTCVKCLSPRISTSPPKNHKVSVPRQAPFDQIKTIERQNGRGSSSAVELFSSHGLERVSHEESTLIPWLLHMSRAPDELISLSSMSLLATLSQLKLTRTTTDASVALLLVPSLVQMLDKAFLLPKPSNSLCQTGIYASFVDQVKAEAPAILAKMTINNPKTQKAAFDSGAIKNLAQLLKQSYDPINAEASHPLWLPESGSGLRKVHSDPSRQMGPVGISAAARDVMRVRESTLVGLAALASTKDEFRKTTVDSGVVPIAVRALKAEEVKFANPTPNIHDDKMDIVAKIAANGCRETVLAACGLLRALSRSVATLRTSMVEAGLLEPLFELLRCSSMKLKIQATAVVCNLSLEFSPLKEV